MGTKRSKGKSITKKATKVVKKMGFDLSSSPLGRAARGKHTRGFI